ncbi:MAG: CoA transferase, partial [Dehalococcoidia bacterium]
MMQPLEGARVLTLDAGTAGVYAGHVLARFGAEVTVVEPPGGDPIRRLAPFPGDVPNRETGGWWLFLAAGLRSVTLDLRSASARRLLDRSRADVILTPPEDAPLFPGRGVV